MKIGLLALVLAPLAMAATSVPELEDGFEKVTCGSMIKLTHQATGHKLHSHGVSYGSGSQQQSTTAFPAADDSNSFWIVRAATRMQCTRGEAVPCGAVIRLQHSNTKTYLHSHQHVSPLSHQQEVSCYDGVDSGDDWRIECTNSGSKHWLREEPIQLVHIDTKHYLSSSPNHKYGQPIPGQLEVAAAKSSSKTTRWIAQEGIYYAASL